MPRATRHAEPAAIDECRRDGRRAAKGPEERSGFGDTQDDGKPIAAARPDCVFQSVDFEAEHLPREEQDRGHRLILGARPIPALVPVLLLEEMQEVDAERLLGLPDLPVLYPSASFEGFAERPDAVGEGFIFRRQLEETSYPS